MSLLLLYLGAVWIFHMPPDAPVKWITTILDKVDIGNFIHWVENVLRTLFTSPTWNDLVNAITRLLNDLVKLL